jgi:site-specific DNA-methyltransferase (adenine-specific)
VGVKDIRELRDVISRQKAAIGIFLTLEEPTSEMSREAKATDPYISPVWKHEYQKIQILTIEDLLKGKRPEIPPTISVFQEASLTQRVSRDKQQTLFT